MHRLKMSVAAALLAGSTLCSPAMAQSSSPFSFGSTSSSSAPGFFLLPTAIALGFGLAVDNMKMKDIATREVLSAVTNRYWDATLYWQIAQAAAIVTLLQAGYYDHRGDVTKVTQPGGLVFATTGDLQERGLFFGIGVNTALNGSGSSAFSVSSAPAIALAAALSLGYGWQKFSAFGGGFTQKQEGLFVRGEVGLEIPIQSGPSANIVLVPALVYTHYNGDRISGDNLVGLVRVLFRF